MEVLEQLSLAVKLFPKLYSQGKAFVEERDDEVHLNRFSQTSSWNPFISIVIFSVFRMNALHLKLLSLSIWKNKHMSNTH